MDEIHWITLIREVAFGELTERDRFLLLTPPSV